MVDDLSFSAIVSGITAFLVTFWDSILSAVPDDALGWVNQQLSASVQLLGEWFPRQSRPSAPQVISAIAAFNATVWEIISGMAAFLAAVWGSVLFNTPPFLAAVCQLLGEWFPPFLAAVWDIISRTPAFIATVWDSILTAVPDGELEWIRHQLFAWVQLLREWVPPKTTLLQIISRTTAFLASFWNSILSAVPDNALERIRHQSLATVQRVVEWVPPNSRPSLLQVCLLLLAVALFHSCCYKRDHGKIMKAPGRGGEKMSRGTFEGNPRSYFLDLRQSKRR